MFTQTVEYALRAAVHLADRAPASRTTAQVAAATHVPRPYLSKVLQALAEKGLVLTQRGVKGGVTLAKAPEDITILEVVNAVDPLIRIRTCPLGLASHGARLCPLHRRVDQALKLVEDAFASTTLAEVLAEPGASVPLCDFPSVQPLKVRRRG